MVSYFMDTWPSVVDVYELLRCLGTGIYTSERTLDVTSQVGVHKYNFSLGVIQVRYKHDWIHCHFLKESF